MCLTLNLCVEFCMFKFRKEKIFYWTDKKFKN